MLLHRLSKHVLLVNVVPSPMMMMMSAVVFYYYVVVVDYYCCCYYCLGDFDLDDRSGVDCDDSYGDDGGGDFVCDVVEMNSNDFVDFFLFC